MLAFPDTHAHVSMIFDLLQSSNINLQDAFILDPGTEPNDFYERKEKLKALSNVKLASGIWPGGEALDHINEILLPLEQSILEKECVAVGECGFDYHYEVNKKNEQKELFNAQIEFAIKYSKPLIVHSRDAFLDTYSAIKDAAQKIPVIIHCFGYDKDCAEKFLSCGCYISFAGNITYKKSINLCEACSIVPDNKLFLETDSPYMCPSPKRGKTCTPLDIERTYDFIATLRNTNLENLVDIVNNNIYSVFPKIA